MATRFVYFKPSYWTRDFPPIVGIRWFNVAVLTITPSVALCGFMMLSMKRETAFFSVIYYIFSMLGPSSLFDHGVLVQRG
jgi:stearoyl-CoA desaturase (delta-9 desaturase)